MNKNHFLINTITHLINLFTFSTMILIASPSHSQANCYMLDQNGDLLDLSSICGQKPVKTNSDVAEEESEKDSQEKDESPEEETSNNSEEDQENSSTNDNGDSSEEEENNSDENDSEEEKEEREDNPENTK